MMDNIYYVYVYYDPRKSNEPIYVGKGREDRAYSHTKYCSNPILKYKLDKIELENLEPIIKIYKEYLKESEAFALEVKLIEKYGRIDKETGTLCNLTDGGEGQAGNIQAVEQLAVNRVKNSGTYEERYGIETANRLKLLRSEQLKGNSYGKLITKEGRKRISISSSRPKSTLHKHNMSKQFEIISPDGLVVIVVGHIGLRKYSLTVGFKEYALSCAIWKKERNYQGYTIYEKEKK